MARPCCGPAAEKVLVRHWSRRPEAHAACCQGLGHDGFCAGGRGGGRGRLNLERRDLRWPLPLLPPPPGSLPRSLAWTSGHDLRLGEVLLQPHDLLRGPAPNIRHLNPGVDVVRRGVDVAVSDRR
jgi:hypothetical protein